MSILGPTADARIISRSLRNECLNYRYYLDIHMHLNRLFSLLGNKMLLCTQRYYRQPYGAGLQVVGF